MCNEPNQILDSIKLNGDWMVVVEVPLVASRSTHEPSKGYMALLNLSKLQKSCRTIPLSAFLLVREAQKLVFENASIFKFFWEL